MLLVLSKSSNSSNLRWKKLVQQWLATFDNLFITLYIHQQFLVFEFPGQQFQFTQKFHEIEAYE